MHKFDPKCFSIATPKKGTSDHLRIFDPIDGVYTSRKQIISDMYDVLTPIKYILEAEGCIIPDVKNVKKCGWGGEGKFEGVIKSIMGERGCGYWLRMTMVQIRRKIAQICTWCKVNADQVIIAVV